MAEAADLALSTVYNYRQKYAWDARVAFFDGAVAERVDANRFDALVDARSALVEAVPEAVSELVNLALARRWNRATQRFEPRVVKPQTQLNAIKTLLDRAGLGSQTTTKIEHEHRGQVSVSGNVDHRHRADALAGLPEEVLEAVAALDAEVVE